MTVFGAGLDKCIKCSICVEHCPVYRVDRAFPGPKQSGPDSERFRHHRETWHEDWLASCSHCTLCETACPSGVPIASIILASQARQIEREGKKPVHRLLASPSFFGKLAMLAPWMVNFSLRLKVTRRFMKMIFGIDPELPFPAYKRFSFQRRQKQQPEKVLYFHGCTVRYNQPEIYQILSSLLEKLNVEIIIPPQDCCGLPKLCNSEISAARKLARKQIDSFSAAPWAHLPIIYNCTSCGHTLANEWAQFADERQKFESFAQRLFNIHEFLMDLLETRKPVNLWSRKKIVVAYHTPCHLRSLGIGLPGARILRLIPALELHVLNTGCCGLSGTYGYKPGRGDIARQIGDEVATAIKKIRPDFIVTDCGSCRLQLQSLTSIQAKDPLEIVASAMVS
ncbi:anaerobic glycerol-3-phosphate dehydrogenase subunit C [candidate division CSSED10-310 bacterium]|uniref:Anaerobic glycerol-3-phosphate dehydrogenase subunit C n=1 Tax=candidate division CSSED10-310 bacterium TaxID=2855610 RepID=A0ABV6YVU6_UNCC1